MKLIITEELWDKIMYWTELAPGEVSGLGRIKFDRDAGEFRLTQVYLLEQESSSAETELDAEAISKLGYETRNDDGELRWWWHSHGSMGVFWSGTDSKAHDQLSEHGWFVSTVVNKAGESLTCLSVGQPFRLSVDKLDTEIEYPEKLLPEAPAWKTEFEAKVREPKPKYLTGGYTSRSGFGYQGVWSADEYEYDAWRDFDKKKTPELPAKKEVPSVHAMNSESAQIAIEYLEYLEDETISTEEELSLMEELGLVKYDKQTGVYKELNNDGQPTDKTARSDKQGSKG